MIDWLEMMHARLDDWERLASRPTLNFNYVCEKILGVLYAWAIFAGQGMRVEYTIDAFDYVYIRLHLFLLEHLPLIAVISIQQQYSDPSLAFLLSIDPPHVFICCRSIQLYRVF
jgi:hypothetical protein